MDLQSVFKNQRMVAFGRYSRIAVSIGFPALMAFAILYKIIVGLTLGEMPKPQIPPHGYLAHENRVVLTWDEGDYLGQIRLQVSFEEDNFAKQ